MQKKNKYLTPAGEKTTVRICSLCLEYCPAARVPTADLARGKPPAMPAGIN